MDLTIELERLLAALEAAEAPYALAGGLALAVHGVVRATIDIDLLVPGEALEQVSEVARNRGFRGSTELRFSSGLEIRRLVKIVEEDTLVLDLLRAETTDAEALRSRERSRLGDLEFWVVSRDGLRRLKTAAGRDQDLADLRRLKELDG
jgi:hypothetical protein